MERKTSLFLAAFVAFLFSTTTFADQRFVANLSGAQEVPVRESAGKGVCTIVLNSAETQITANCSYSGVTSNVVGDHIHGNARPGVNAGILFNFNFTGGTSGSFSGTFNVTPQQVADMRAGLWYVNVHTSNFTGGEIRGQIKRADQIADLDGDGRSDVAVTRQSNQTTYYLSSVRNALVAQQFGQAGDLSGSLDIDGDGLSDFVRVRLNPQTFASTISILRSSDNTTSTVQLGDVSQGDVPAFGDYDGDGRVDLAAFRTTNGLWTILQSSNGQIRTETFGQANDRPVPGDYDKDGKADLAVVRFQGQQMFWYIKRSSTGAFYGFPWGLATDGFFNAGTGMDIDADGASDPVIVRNQGGSIFYYGLQSSNGALWARQWGAPTDILSLGDYDGDGRADPVAIRNVNGVLAWFILRSTDNSFQTFYWGAADDQPNLAN